MAENESARENSKENELADRKNLPPAAQRALKEAEERRAAQKKQAAHTEELGGPKGAEPTRYGDWERNGRAVDF